MKELLQAPTEGYGEAIVIPEINADHFEIKTNLLQLVQANPNHGFERENPHTHINNFKRITLTLKFRDVLNDVVTPFTVKAFDESCVTCGGNHAYYNCDATNKPDVSKNLPKPNIPYPSRLNDQKLQEKATNQMEKFYQIFQDLHFDISFTDALLLMPKFASTIKSLLANKDKLFELAKISLNENFSAMILKKLPEKLGDPGKFLIPCDFLRMDVCHALANLADRSITRPKGVAEDVFVKVGKFHFPTDFVVVDFKADPRVPLILGRSFLRTGRALINVYGEEITLWVNDEAITFNLNQTMRNSSTYDDLSHALWTLQCPWDISKVYTMEVFTDDFLVFRDSFSSCFSHLDTMLQRCEDTNLVLNWEKCHFMVKEGIVIGHKISKNVLEVNRSKVYVIAKLPYATTVKGVRSFLGHASFYRRFIQDFFKISRPMTHLLEKETPFVFSKDFIDAFETLKKNLTEASILVIPDWNLPFELMCDASDFSIGAVPGQRPFPYSRGNTYILVTVDYLSKWVEEKALPTNDARVVVKILKSLLARFGTPKAIISDRGTHFCNDKFAKVMSKYGVTHRLATPYHPQTSGQVEVSNHGLKRILERTVGENRASWSEKLEDTLWAFRTAYKTPIGCTPYKIVYGKYCHLHIELEHKAYWALKHIFPGKLKTRWSGPFTITKVFPYGTIELSQLDGPNFKGNSLIYKEKTKKIHDSKIKNRIFNVGDRVLLFNSHLKIFSGKLKTRWSGPFTITKVFPYGTVELSQANGPNFKVNGQRVKHYFGGDVPHLVVPDLQTFCMDK
nr:reverse transcriptase domain-containing protein [Tanacetum cinerariifolium]